jgi:carbonic anhydrase/acetyltransferase-like protein (isoleucine patch superfamily)
MILSFNGVMPKIAESVYIAPSADIIGDVAIGEESSVWFNTVIRGDVHFIRIGTRTSIQDISMLHVTRKTHPLIIGDEVTVGHHVTLHGCTIGNRVLIGMGAIILDGAEIGDGSIVGAGALVTEGIKVPTGVLVLGIPAKVVRPLTETETAFLSQSAKNYINLGATYRKKGIANSIEGTSK